MSKKILVPIDGSKISHKALEFAISMAKAYGDQIRLVNIQPNHQILGQSVIDEAAAILEEARVLYTSTIRVGTPTVEIITESKDDDIRCIVMGKKGKGNTSKNLGSVSLGILQMASCPIVFIPV